MFHILSINAFHRKIISFGEIVYVKIFLAFCEEDLANGI